MYFKNKKAISPLIATILLIVVAVAIIGIVLSWGKGFANTSLSSADNISSSDSFSGLVWSFQTTGNNVLVENKSKQDLNITGYTINSLDYNGFWINSYHPSETTLSISPGTSNNISLICMPEGKFILTLKTSNNENILLNISPSKTLLGGTCEEYNVSLWEFVSGTGSNSINIYNVQEGELIVNGSFDTDTNWTKGTGWTINNGKLNSDGSQTAISYAYQSSSVVLYKKYKVIFTVSDYVSGTVNIRVGNSAYGNGVGTFRNSNGTYEQILTCLGSSGGYIWIEASTNFIGSVDNFSIVEVSPLETILNGTKYLQNTTAGTTAIESPQAYGTWEFDVYKGADGSKVSILFFADKNILSEINGYDIDLTALEGISIFKATNGIGSPIMVSSTSYILNNTWYRIKILRLENENLFNDIPNLIAVGNFDTNTGWTEATGWVISNGTANFNGGSGISVYKGFSGITTGAKYKVSYDVVDYVSGGVKSFFAGLSGVTRNSVGHYEDEFVYSGGNATLYFMSVGASQLSIDNVVVKRIYPANTFAVFIKGGSFGEQSWTLVPITSGNNPVTDSTYTTSNYFVADLDAGDRITNVKMKESVD